jgi:hypothetical protein
LILLISRMLGVWVRVFLIEGDRVGRECRERARAR